MSTAVAVEEARSKELTAMSLFETARGGAHAYIDSAVMLLVGRYLDRRARGVMRAARRHGCCAQRRGGHGARGAARRARAGDAADRGALHVGLAPGGRQPAASWPLAGSVSVLVWLIPIALALGALRLAAFLWALRSGQFDDLDGAAERILFDDD